ELEADRARHLRLAMVDCGLKHFPLRAEPEAIIDKLGITRRELVLEMRGTPAERQPHDPAMSQMRDGTARRLIHAARLHADIAVLDQVEATDAMATAICVERFEQRRGAHPFAIDGNAVATLESDRDIFGHIGRVFG